MSIYGDRAEQLFYLGYNCCQSTAAPFAALLGLPEETMLRLACGLGGGVGRLREVCGGLSGAAVVLGGYYANPNDPEDKSRIYAMVQEIAARFKAENGLDTYLCRELLNGSGATTGPLAEQRTPEYYAKRPCPRLVRLAAELTAQYIAEHPRAEAAQ